VLANDPATLARTWANVKEVMGQGALDPLVKELIYIAISAVNNCAYCVHTHTHAARARGMTDAMQAELLQVLALASQTNRLAIALVEPGGVLVTCSCSGLWSMDEFERTVVLAVHKQSRRLQFFDRTGRVLGLVTLGGAAGLLVKRASANTVYQVDPSKCTSCDLCRTSCVLSHSAVKAVKQWKYEPAKYKGQPITVYRIIQIPFKLNV
jgi:AhpD family alkylhydroperoxidase